jgi:signal transduction histidine kinase
MTSSDVNHVIDTCLALFSHEVRSPLSTILGWSQIISSKRLTGDQLDVACRAIERSANDITALVNEVGYLRSILHSGREHGTAPMTVSTVINAAVEAVKCLAADRRVSVRVLDSTEGVELAALDREKAAAIFTSLIAHAIRGTQQRGEVAVEVIARGNSVVVAVEAARGEEGLYLAIARALSELCGGVLSLEDRGRGTPAALTVVLPISRAAGGGEAMGF